MRSMTKIHLLSRFIPAILFSIAFSVVSCSDDETSSTGTPYNPNKPVKLGTFYPDSGGIATKVIITGENFGTEASAVKVWYNQKRAAVVQAIGDRLYVITPRQPGEACTISVVVGKDSVTFDQTFEYTTQTTVTTVAGKGGIGAQKMVDGTLSEAEFYDPRYVCVDAENNVFVSDCYGHAIRLLNEEENMVTTLVKGTSMCQYPNALETDSEGRTVFAMLDGATDGIVELNPDIEWAPRKVRVHAKAGTPDFNLSGDWTHSVTNNWSDGLMYFRTYKGTLIKFDPKTKEAEAIYFNLEAQTDSYLAFHPTTPNLLYICFAKLNKIMTLEVNKEGAVPEHYAGSEDGVGGKGWEDGYRLDAKFNDPRQIVFDEDNNLFVADTENNCIRKITPDGNVSTVIGIPGSDGKGFVDGGPDDALFSHTSGVSISREGVIYVADRNNRAIRKLSIE